MSCLCCRIRRTSQVSLIPPQTETTTSIPVKNSTSITSSRPIEDTFPKPKRRRTAPSTSLIKLFSASTSSKTTLTRRHTTELRLSTGNSLTKEKMSTQYNQLYNTIVEELLEQWNDMDQPWVSLKWCQDLLERKDLNVTATLKEIKGNHAYWRNDTSSLEDFVRKYAPRLFAVLVYTRTEELLDQFCTKRIGDDKFPIKLYKVKKTHVSIGGDAPTEFTIRSTRRPDAMNLFETNQWKFFVPELSWTAFNHPPLNSKSTYLPFLGEPEEISSTAFSIVSKCLVHYDYIPLEEHGLVSSRVTCYAPTSRFRIV
jgi:hypothetical protein